MQFVDQVRVLVRAGNGGDGAVAWRREKFVPRGGPAGGDGGRGGCVVLRADEHLSTLLDLRYRQHLTAAHGESGGSRDRNGRSGDDLVVRVPLGTVVTVEAIEHGTGSVPPWVRPIDDDDDEDFGATNKHADLFADQKEEVEPVDEVVPSKRRRSRPYRGPVAGDRLGDLTEHGQELVVALGGRGGRGNIHFRSSTNRAPHQAERGGEGQAFWIRLELKLLADIGIVGFPNVGKSTLIARISRARPKIADYPFTTLVPQLGVVSLPGERSMVVADVPGLIVGASEGKGLGHDFLRHLERTRVLLHLLAPLPEDEREPVADFDALERELAAHGSMFDGRPRIVALNKADLLADHEGDAVIRSAKEAFEARKIPLFVISAHTGAGVPELLEALWRRLDAARRS